VGHVHTLPTRQPVIAVATINDKICVLRKKREEAIEVYDVATYVRRRFMTVPDTAGYNFVDMVACQQNQCLYFANSPDKRVHRLELQNRATQWSVEDEPSSLSLNRDHNLLVICPAVRQIKEYSSEGKIVREVELPTDLLRPLHAVQLRRGEFVVCHGDLADGLHRVCTVSADGSQIVRSHGGQKGSDNGQCSGLRRRGCPSLTRMKRCKARFRNV